MDELVIGDKKYLSSKRAAEITGYAKDYVGQLCREGRVEARLVGRSWYVLDSAIQGHRFGTPESPAELSPKAQIEPRAPVAEAFYTYKPEQFEPIPLVSPKKAPMQEQEQPLEQVSGGFDAIHSMQEAWKDWFTSSRAPAEAEFPKSEAGEESQVEVIVPFKQFDTEEVSVPIHALEEPIQNQSPVEPKISPRIEIHSDRFQKLPKYRKYYSTLRVVLVFLSVVAVLIAILGSGAVDKRVVRYVGSLGALSGVGFYQSGR